MQLIQPCCTQRHWPALRSKLGTDGTALFRGFGDLSLADLLPVILIRYSEAEMMLVTPTLPDTLAETILYWLRRSLPVMSGGGQFHVLSRLTLITNLSEKKSPMASRWLADNPFPGRLTLHSVQQCDTALILPDLAIYGAVNLVYNGHFTAIATKNAGMIASLRSTYLSLVQ